LGCGAKKFGKHWDILFSGKTYLLIFLCIKVAVGLGSLISRKGIRAAAKGDKYVSHKAVLSANNALLFALNSLLS
jgi:hypothetical protein